MDLADGVADLHMHTTASDGTAAVADRIERAGELGLSAIAITDHDRVDERLDNRSETVNGVEVITGVEIRAGIRGTKIELLGYYVDPGSTQLESLLSDARGYREARNREMVERLVEETSIDATFEELSAAVDGTLGRPHLAARLVEDGEVDSVGEAFQEYLGREGACYVGMERADFETVVEVIQAAGGIASLAHPGRIAADAAFVEDTVEELVAAGLDGIEVWYPYDRTAGDDRYADIDVATADSLAAEHDLLRTGGSDCHGPDSGKDRFGQARVPADALQRLRDAAGV